MNISKSESYREFDRASLDKYRDLNLDTDRDDNSSIRSEALGDELPPGYYYSPQFLGAMAVAYLFLILPTNVLSFINADIGMKILDSCSEGL
ncbi:trichothecene efflux pump [Colletotrichum tofieldiae]|nr:trichothecene efflux pump [Colletotrichum tofieldiae]GKT81432.1 trichothecene efflux pump [Colletotrichum tofieldiae]